MRDWWNEQDDQGYRIGALAISLLMLAGVVLTGVSWIGLFVVLVPLGLACYGRPD